MSVSLVLQPPSLKLERLQSILSQLNVSSDMSIDATALEKILGKTNRSYEESVQGMAFMKQLCTKHDLNKAAFISSGKRGAKKQGDASNGRRYSQEVALHFAQWADAALAVEIGEALALLISGQVKTEDSIRIATSVEAAIEKGRDMAPMEEISPSTRPTRLSEGWDPLTSSLTSSRPSLSRMRDLSYRWRP